MNGRSRIHHHRQAADINYDTMGECRSVGPATTEWIYKADRLPGAMLDMYRVRDEVHWAIVSQVK